MHRSTRRRFLTTTSALFAGASVAESLRSLAYAAPKKNEWITLFDGKTLDGWHKNPEKIVHGTGGNWQVEEGTITGEQDPPGSGNGGILLTNAKFGDFEVEIDIQPDWGVCSGFFLRGNDRGECFQMMVDYHDQGNVGHLFGEGTGGFSTRTFDINGKYDDDKNLIGITTANHKSAAEVGLVHTCQPAEWVEAWKLNDWNTARVQVEGKYPRITTWINDLLVNEFDGDSSSNEVYQKHKERVLESLSTQGSIAVQVHAGSGWPVGAKCRWKNVKIREL